MEKWINLKCLMLLMYQALPCWPHKFLPYKLIQTKSLTADVPEGPFYSPLLFNDQRVRNLQAFCSDGSIDGFQHCSWKNLLSLKALRLIPSVFPHIIWFDKDSDIRTKTSCTQSTWRFLHSWHLIIFVPFLFSWQKW